MVGFQQVICSRTDLSSFWSLWQRLYKWISIPRPVSSHLSNISMTSCFREDCLDLMTAAPSTVLASTERSVVTSPTSSAASSLFSGATPTYTTLQGSDASSYSSQASDRTTTTEEPAVLSDDVVFHGTSGAEYNHPALSYLLLLCLTFIWSNYY